MRATNGNQERLAIVRSELTYTSRRIVRLLTEPTESDSAEELEYRQRRRLDLMEEHNKLESVTAY